MTPTACTAPAGQAHDGLARTGMMVGIVVSNGILLVEFANVQLSQGMDAVEAVVTAGRVRLRPILMTTLTTLLGLLPMAIGIGEGSESNVPLARAVVGGLMVSTLFTLVLIPVLYTVLKRRPSRFAEPLSDPSTPA